MYTIADKKKAVDILVLDMRRVSNLCDYFFICSAESTRQARAIADAVKEALAAKAVRPLHTEGYTEGRWVLLDYNSVVAHIFYSEIRSFYKLERLWGDAPAVKFSNSKKRPCKKISSKKKYPA